MEPETVRLVDVDRCRAEVAVGAGVAARELALEDVHPVLAARLEIVAPRERVTLEPAAGGAAPTRPRSGSRVPDHAAVGLRVVPRDVDDGMVGTRLDVRLRALRVAPRRALDLAPPRCLGDGASVGEVVRQQPGEHERPAEALGVRLPAGGVDEPGERDVGDRVRVDAERVELDPVHRVLTVARVRPDRLVAHRERRRWYGLQGSRVHPTAGDRGDARRRAVLPFAVRCTAGTRHSVFFLMTSPTTRSSPRPTSGLSTAATRSA